MTADAQIMPSGEATTITVSAAAVSPALVPADFTLSANTTLTIAAEATTSTGTVTITALDNDVDAPNKQVTVSAGAANTQGVNAPADLTLTLEDDEAAPTATLILSAAFDRRRTADQATVIGRRSSHPSSEATTLTVTVTAGANAVTADFTLSANTILTIAAGETSSTGTVTIEAVDNSADHANKEVTVSAGAANTQGVNAILQDVTLTHHRRRGGDRR